MSMPTGDDLWGASRDVVYDLFSQLKQIHEDIFTTRARLTYFEGIKVIPLTLSVQHYAVYTEFCTLHSIRSVAEEIQLDTYACLDVLLEFLFQKDQPIDFVPLMREFGVSTDCVRLVRNYFASVARISLRDALHTLLLPPSMLKIALAVLYKGLPIESLTAADNDLLDPTQISGITEDEILRRFDETYEKCMRSRVDHAAEHESMWEEMKQEGENVSKVFEDVNSQLKQLKERLHDYEREQDSRRAKQEEFGRQLNDEYHVDDTPAPQDYTASSELNRQHIDCVTSCDDDVMIIDTTAIVQAPKIFGPMHDSQELALISVDHLQSHSLALKPPSLLPELEIGSHCYARKLNRHWYEAKVLDRCTKRNADGRQELWFKVQFDQGKHSVRDVSAKWVAFAKPASWVLPVGSRVIAYYQDGTSKGFFGGMVAEFPTIRNRDRYLVFFDDGYTQYCAVTQVYRVVRASEPIWQDMEPQTQDFVADYLSKYPEKAMVRLVKGTTVQAEYGGHFSATRILDVDASLAKLMFSHGRIEWIYRGSTRLGPLFYQQIRSQNARERGKMVPSSTTLRRGTQPVVEYTQLTEQEYSTLKTGFDMGVMRALSADNPGYRVFLKEHQLPERSLPRGRPHTCSWKCLGDRDRNAERDFKNENPLMIPLLCGWERRLGLRTCLPKRTDVSYVAPCGRRLCTVETLAKFLAMTDSWLMIDWFCYDFNVRVTRYAETPTALYKTDDIARGKEAVRIPAVNVLNENVPPVVDYMAERRAPTINLNNDGSFVSCCDCKDNCLDRLRCACQQLTFQAARMHNHWRDYPQAGYHHRRLKLADVVHSIFECNANCKCDKRCVNRVVQRPLQRRLQVFFTGDKGWGIRTLDDIPKGTFVCTYAGEILTDDYADTYGKDYGDEFLAQLDHIEYMEQSLDEYKEGYEAQAIPPEGDDLTGSDEEDNAAGGAKEKEDSSNSGGESKDSQDAIGVNSGATGDGGDGSSFVGPTALVTAAAGQSQGGARTNEQAKPPPPAGLRSFYNEDGCYIMNAKHTGNVGRYLNHSCEPNCQVHNVFIDTHDLRFPHVAFFASQRIVAGSELCWDYAYEVDSVPNKKLTCHCGSEECRGRLL